MTLKGNRGKDGRWPEYAQNVLIFSYVSSFTCSVNIYIYFELIFECLLEPCSGRMFTSEWSFRQKKRLARDVFNAFATYSGHVHDVTDADCGVQNGSTDGRVFETFKCRVLTGPEIE